MKFLIDYKSIVTEGYCLIVIQDTVPFSNKGNTWMELCTLYPWWKGSWQAEVGPGKDHQKPQSWKIK